ncbi:unnamed protein product [Somion occarium]|uniref:GTP-binding protein n=1 Tax=Somion occarium TaxID=3059160 RepID=A0ABP1EBP5_9APHY
MTSLNGYGSSSSTVLSQTNGVNGHTKSPLRTKILLLGMRRAGKTSIYEYVFNDLPAKQTFYLETTTRVTKHHYDTVIPLEIWDCPGTTTLETLETPLTQFSTLIFVIDIQDLYQQPISRLVDFVISAYQDNPNMNLEVFVHKADALSEEYKIENFRHIQQRVSEELLDISEEYEQIPINFHLTSIYDHSAHEAFSRVLHKLIDSLPFLEDMLNVFCSNSQSSKAFLFDTKSRLYVATDASPVDPPTHSLCNNYLQMLNSFGPLYKSVSASPLRQRTISPPELTPTSSGVTSPTTPHSVPTSASETPRVPSSSLQHTSPSSSSQQGPSTPLSPTQSTPSVSSPISSSSASSTTPRRKSKISFYPCASTSLSPSASGAGTTLTYHLINPKLALLALLPTSVYESRRGLVEYNVVFFREGVQEICEVEDEIRKGGGG